MAQEGIQDYNHPFGEIHSTGFSLSGYLNKKNTANMLESTTKATLFWLCSLILLQSFHYSKGFLVEPALTRKPTDEKQPSFVVAKASSSSAADLKDDSELQVVLFGVGDLRVDDHQGLVRAFEHGNSKNPAKILPLIILSDDSMSKIPGVISHTMDTSNMVVEAVKDLQSNLRDNLALELQVVQTKDSLTKALADILKDQCDSNQQIRVHVHDLGDADNSMGYGTYGPVRKERNNLPPNVKVSPWTCHLREKPWETVESLPDRYPDFEKKFAASQMPALPVSVSDMVKDGSMSKAESVPLSSGGKSDDATVGIPTSKQLTERIQGKLGLDSEVIKAEVNTGIFQSHWGGLDASTVAESKVFKVLGTFVKDCSEEDALWVKNGQYVASKCPRNPRSLEHATYAWMQRGTGKEAPYPETDNLLAGEPMTRYLAAPLTLGTLSPRRLWHMSTRQRPFFVSPLKTLVEGREWHKLLAARNIRTQPEYQPNSELAVGSETRYGYWRWHGFLCRYAQTPLTSGTKELDPKEGVLLFHGFGASGAQWNKALQELSTIVREEEPEGVALEGLAPDFLGFGQSEKPALSYSIYVWDAQCSDFIKEVAVAKQGWDSYVVGGNSIGGFSAASTAANECAEIDGNSVCSSGSPGTGKCRGVVLMNPAGPIKSREESETQMMMTVAQTSATDALPPW